MDVDTIHVGSKKVRRIITNHFEAREPEAIRSNQLLPIHPAMSRPNTPSSRGTSAGQRFRALTNFYTFACQAHLLELFPWMMYVTVKHIVDRGIAIRLQEIMLTTKSKKKSVNERMCIKYNNYRSAFGVTCRAFAALRSPSLALRLARSIASFQARDSLIEAARRTIVSPPLV